MVSIIIPVYNAGAYLRRCVDSVLAQTYTDWELILVNDGSKDTSPSICDEYAARDSRIRAIHKENGGVSTARNAGVDAAKGEWICFIDADDYVGEDYVRSMWRQVSGNETDVLVVAGVGGSYAPIHLDTETLCAGDGDFIAKIENLPCFPISKLFNAQIIKSRNLRFPCGITNGEDFVFCCQYYSCVNKIYKVSATEYFYELSEMSVTSRVSPYPQAQANFLAMRAAWKEFLSKYGVEACEDMLWQGHIAARFRELLRSVCLSEGTFSWRLRTLVENSQLITAYCNNTRSHGYRDRVALYCLSHKMNVAYLLFNKLMRMLGKGAAA